MLLAKVGLATAAVAITTAGAGFTGVLPIPAAQEAFDRAFRSGVVPVEVPDPTDRIPVDADTDPGPDPTRSPMGEDTEGVPPPVPGTPSPRRGASSDPAEGPAPTDQTTSGDRPLVQLPGQPHEQPRSPLDTEQGRDAGPVRPELPATPTEDGREDPTGRSDGASQAPEVEPGQDAPSRVLPAPPPTRRLRPGPGGPAPDPEGLAPEPVSPDQGRPRELTGPEGQASR